jgi:hypothetical protein
LIYRDGELGSLPREVADLVRVAARDVQRAVNTTLNLAKEALTIHD